MGRARHPGRPGADASNATLDRYFTNIKAATRLSPELRVGGLFAACSSGSRAINSGLAQLPNNLNAAGLSGGHRSKPVATHLDEVTRGNRNAQGIHRIDADAPHEGGYGHAADRQRHRIFRGAPRGHIRW
jgi:hypothetical protein